MAKTLFNGIRKLVGFLLVLVGIAGLINKYAVTPDPNNFNYLDPLHYGPAYWFITPLVIGVLIFPWKKES